MVCATCMLNGINSTVVIIAFSVCGFAMFKVFRWGWFSMQYIETIQKGKQSVWHLCVSVRDSSNSLYNSPGKSLFTRIQLIAYSKHISYIHVAYTDMANYMYITETTTNQFSNNRK